MKSPPLCQLMSIWCDTNPLPRCPKHKRNVSAHIIEHFRAGAAAGMAWSGVKIVLTRSNASLFKLQLESPRGGFIFFFFLTSFSIMVKDNCNCFQNLHRFGFQFLVNNVRISLGGQQKAHYESLAVFRSWAIPEPATDRWVDLSMTYFWPGSRLFPDSWGGVVILTKKKTWITMRED